MTGGAFKNTSNLLGRKREIDELEELCGKSLRAAERLQEELTLNEGQLEQQREELEQLNTDLDETKESFSQAGLSRQQLEGQIEILKEQIHSVRANDVPPLKTVHADTLVYD